MPQQVPLNALKRTLVNDNDDDQDDDQDQDQQDLLLVSTNYERNTSSSKETSNSDSSTSQQEMIINSQVSSVEEQANKNTQIMTNANNSITNNETNNFNKDNKKLNGLKNRIIQRPPPLILDKVSNFYDTTTSQTLAETDTTTNDKNNCKSSNYTNLNLSETNNNFNNNKQQTSTPSNITTTTTTTTNNANSKFWASLNQNAAFRSKQQAGINNIKSNNNFSSTNDITRHSSSIDSPNSLGADLIISHRNQSTTLPLNRTSNNHNNINSSTQIKNSLKIENFSDEKKKTCPNNSTNENNLEHNLDDSTGSNKLNVSNNSDGINENEAIGGNLIGVENLTPPASDSNRLRNNNNNEPPASASSSRPRSNNPFLEMEDDDTQSTVEATTNNDDNNNLNNFHTRPASFIAATDATTFMNQRRKQQQANIFDRNTSYTTETSTADSSKSKQLIEQFQNMYLDSTASSEQMFQQQQKPYHSATNFYLDQKDSFLVDQQRPQSFGETKESIYGGPTSTNKQVPHSPYKLYEQNSNFVDRNSTINLDSERAVSNPPPSATMQLPVWTEAIYHLNNAILDTNSVAGGAENGKFIYIVESGDIILELDQIKVSGFTLPEFNELLESKSIHLLTAVQTKHSHGLTTDLKQFLNSSFPNNSMDKELQNQIRENIYRKTIPITTRPPRKGEVDKVHYYFLTKEQFVKMNDRGMLLECGMYGGHYYGTMRPLCDLNNSSIYGSLRKKENSTDNSMRQPLYEGHSAISFARREVQNVPINQAPTQPMENPLYENQDSLRMIQMPKMSPPTSLEQKQNIIPSQTNLKTTLAINQRALPSTDSQQLTAPIAQIKPSSIVAVDSEALPQGWERVIDETHGTYYIDHNTQRTQYERPYEIELTKGAMGFGFTLLEADNGVLLVRSVIPGGPAHLNGTIRPGDILISAVGVSVAGLQHTDVARLFSMFAVGDRVRLTLARSTYVVDANLVPDEYLFSNGTNGDLAIAVNSGYYNQIDQNTILQQNPHIVVDQEFDFIEVNLKRGNQGFGFQINETMAGQKVGKIHDSDACSNLKQGDILIRLNNQDITKMTHKEVVELLKNCPPGQNVSLVVRRKKRFRSKTPMEIHTQNVNYQFESQPLRNCKTPSLDGLMYYNQQVQLSSLPTLPVPVSRTNPINLQDQHQFGFVPPSVQNPDGLIVDNMTNSLHQSDTSLPPIKFANINGLNQMNQYNNFMNNDKFVMMQMQQPLYQQTIPTQPQPLPTHMPLQHSDIYSQAPLYSNGHLIKPKEQQRSSLVIKPAIDLYNNNQIHTQESPYDMNYKNSYYANNEEIALQQVQYNSYNNNQQSASYVQRHHLLQQQPQPIYGAAALAGGAPEEEADEYEYHQVTLTRASTDSNWGIRLMGGSEVGRAISIGSIVFGGAASKNGKLKSGDEIISINDINVVGATHQYVVELISACSNRASLMIRRKKFAEACEVILNRNMDEGFGFVIISSGNCALIGKIIEGSPADRCHQLHVKDRIIAVNGRYITPRMQHPEIVNMIKECGSTLRLRIIPADCYTVELIKSSQNDNFGFSMRGGSEYDGTPLYILRVAPNGLARDSLNVGDQIIEINGIPTVGMTHQQAATIIKYSDPIVKLKLRRNYVTPPVVLVDSPRALQEFNQVTAEMKTVNPNPTPNYLHDGAASMSDHSLSSVTFNHHNNMSIPMQENHYQHQSLPIQQHNNQTISEDPNRMIYNQNMPLYAS